MATFKEDIEFCGVGIHKGAPVRMVIHPRLIRGIVFNRVDLGKKIDISALYSNVGETKFRNTTIGDMDGQCVQTIEHLMAALMIVGVDGAVIEIDGPEVPILDGSAYQFLEKFLEVGVVGVKPRRIVVKRPVVVYSREVKKNLPVFERLKFWFLNKLSGRKTDGFVSLSPNDGNGLKVSATLEYPEKIIGSQSFSYFFDGSKKSRDVFLKDVARARTFGKFSEWDYLKKHGMAHGANETNVIAVNKTGDGVLNGLFWHDEFVRHKVVDAVGDMWTSGGIIIGDLVSFKGSHALNNLVLRKLFSDPANYEIVEK
ncbi:MAG: UDP-3-O-[3-hydroxymyristoyl] N-acetylglucosamine deacetylase [Proteobacteria bacterium]|nr:UDP-3-O-[3-hydroxymyristoyl] N-acetylglucosamine deacetylase [Candidatus Enterousia onthequi]